jgi:bifunctional UDP-N-acetylglucosamine pyrophosphorylase/glucosamine-1-phosphate N-acetyltransferase
MLVPHEQTAEIVAGLKSLSSKIDLQQPRLAIILAAGHGKRIRSERSKMLHHIWGKPTVTRVAQAARHGLDSSNQIIVVGIKAVDVAEALGTDPQRVFVYQQQQNGTGDAVRVALEALPGGAYAGDVYVFPGDMGLLNNDAIKDFREEFEKNRCDMMGLTADYQGDPRTNYYGRILRVPEKDAAGRSSGDDLGKVIEIKEHKDILALPTDKAYSVKYNDRTYNFSREQLLAITEFNTGVYAFKAAKLIKHIGELSADNVQSELYITDLIAIFNGHKLTVKAARAQDYSTVLGFNNKSVLKEMEAIAREKAYDRLKDLITIDDQDDFFIADEVIEQIIEMDKREAPLDILVGKGAYIGPQVRLAKGVEIRSRAILEGNLALSEKVIIHENVMLSTYPNQHMKIGRHSQIFQGDIIKGNITIGERCQIESSVNITGSDDFPVIIGNNVLIKGTSYIFGSIIESGIWIEHSVLKNKYVERTVRKDGTVQPVRYVLPLPEGLDSIHDLPQQNEKEQTR